jgi:hypothetical protein
MIGILDSYSAVLSIVMNYRWTVIGTWIYWTFVSTRIWSLMGAYLASFCSITAVLVAYRYIHNSIRRWMVDSFL